MGNKGIATILGGAGGGGPLSAKDASCKAFAAAVDEWCGKSGDLKRGTFNDYFFKALEKTKPSGSELASSMQADETVTAAKPAESIAAAVARGTGGSAQAARRVLQTQAAGGAGASMKAWSKLGANWLAKEPPPDAPRFPHGKLQNAAIAVKAPGDTFEPGKLEEYQSVQREKKVFEVGCESCGEDCAKGNRCK